MSGQIETYRKEIFDFLRTVTIKFEPFAYILGQSYMDKYGLTNPHGTWNPYYIHLAGEYTDEEKANNKQMIVYTVEREEPEQIIFDKNVIVTNPKTAALYKIPNKEYSILEERYPEYVGLIRTIAYPISSINDAIAAPNLSLLGYDASILEENERESIIKCLKDFLHTVRTRWWINEYTYEDMFATTFWCMLWQMLPAVLLSQRFQNIKTENVHSFHIWEYLTSRGLKDYRDVLTMNQSLWLYRNIDYIRQNEGKHKSLALLAENLLQDAYVSMLYKDMYQKTTNFDSLKRTEVDFRSFNFITGEDEKTEQIPDLNSRLNKQGIEHNNTPEYVLDLEERLSTHNYNILNTKYLEFKKDPIDTSDESLMTRVLLDNVIRELATDKLSFYVNISDPINGILMKLFAGDAIMVMYYVTMKACGYEDFPIPDTYYSKYGFPTKKPSVNMLKEILCINGTHLYSDRILDIASIVNLFSYEDKAFVNREDFAEWVTNLFVALKLLNRHSEGSNKYWYHVFLRRLIDNICNGGSGNVAPGAGKTITVITSSGDTVVHEPSSDIECDPVGPEDVVETYIVPDHRTYTKCNISAFSGYSSWESFFNINTTAKEVLTRYEKLGAVDKVEAYQKLATACYDSIFETSDHISGVNNVRHVEKIYDSIRDLFISLGSYNITYLENDRDKFEYLRFYDPDFIYNLDVKNNLHNLFNFTHEEFQWKKSSVSRVVFDKFNVHTEIAREHSTLYMSKVFRIEQPRKQKLVFKDKLNTTYENDISKKRKVFKLHFNINTGTTACLRKEV